MKKALVFQILFLAVFQFCQPASLAQSPSLKRAAAKAEKADCEGSLQEYTQYLQDKGYSVEKSIAPGDITVIKLGSTAKSKEGHGLLNVSWKEKEVWELKYIVIDGKPRLVDVSGEKQHKAPLLGKWETIEKLTAAPGELIWK
jgi:hypothetical protein